MRDRRGLDWGGFAMMLGGILWLLFFPVLWTLGNRDTSNVVVTMLVVASCLLLIFGLVGAQSRRTEAVGLLGQIAVVAMVFALSVLVVASFFIYFVVFILALGSMLYGIANLRARTLPAGLAWLFALSPLPLIVLTLLNIFELPAPERLEEWSLLGFTTLFGLALVLFGYQTRATPAQQGVKRTPE